MKRIAVGLALTLGCGAPSRVEEPSHDAVVGIEDLTDADGDGVIDARDGCRCAAEDVDGFEDDDGCPDADNDQDHRDDACDACPNQPETYNGICDEDGCPDYGRVCVTQEHVVILQRVHFAVRSARLRASAPSEIDLVAQTLAAHPQIERTVVHGHAVAREPRALVLAQRRAQVVLDALVAHGIDATRLSAIGEVDDAHDVSFDIVRFDGHETRDDERDLGCGAVTCEPTLVCPPPASSLPDCERHVSFDLISAPQSLLAMRALKSKSCVPEERVS